MGAGQVLASYHNCVRGKSGRSDNHFVDARPIYKRQAPLFSGGQSNVHMLIAGLDYAMTRSPLSGSCDGRNMEQLARQCGVQDVVAMYNEQCTKRNVVMALQTVARRCMPNDYFIFFYAGHGTTVFDWSFDEDDFMDECFCFVNESGQMDRANEMVDDEFVDIVTPNLREGVRCLIIADCCHSCTIGDLDKPDWDHTRTMSISGCSDFQTSGDIGTGGILTHCMLLAVENIQNCGVKDYSVGMLYNAALMEDTRIFGSEQQFEICASRGVKFGSIAWPLVPIQQYQAPLSRAACMTGAMGRGLKFADPQKLTSMGVSPALLRFISDNANFNSRPRTQNYMDLID